MRIIGMIGGFSPESTIDYYREIIEGVRSATGTDEYPRILINSMDISKLFDLVRRGSKDELASWLADGVRALEKAGAEFAFISANTPHIVFDEVRALSSIPMISIVEAARDLCAARRLRRLGLVGTRFTMESDFYQAAFSREGIELFVPDARSRSFIQAKYQEELGKGVFKDETKEDFLRIIAGMAEEDALDGVILGCTEFPLLLKDEPLGIPFINTTRAHVEKIVRACVEE